MPARRIIVTRPAREAAAWVQALAERGLAATALPLIEIAPPLDVAPLRAAWAQRHAYAALMFVSGNAVRGFFESNQCSPRVDIDDIATNTRAWSPGPGTTRALREARWPSDLIDAPAPDAAQFDSEALWAQVHGQALPGQRVLIVRGADARGQRAGRDWLAAQLRAAGVAVEEVVAYRRAAPLFDADQRVLAEAAAGDGSVWLFSSSEAITHLRQWLPSQSWSAARALATHPRIAEAARQAGFGGVTEVRPTLEAVTASIESLP